MLFRSVTKMSPAVAAAEITTISVLNADTGMRVTPDPATKVDNYRMMITQPTPDKRYKANFGIVSATGGDPAHAGAVGDLRGFSLFRETRIPADQFDRLRRELRAKNNVHGLVTAGPDNTPRAERVE